MARVRREPAEKGIRLSHRGWFLLLPHREVSRSTANFRRKISPGWKTARAWTWTNMKRTAPATLRCGRSPTRRSFVGNKDRAGATGLAHRVLRHVDGGAGRKLRPARRRRGPDLSPPRKRNCPIGIADRQAVRAFLVSLRVFCWWRARRCRRAWATSSLFAIWCSRDTSLRRSLPARICSISQSAEFHF